MEVVAVVGGFVIALGLIAWLVYGRIADARALQAMDDERDKAVVEARDAKYEIAKRDERIADLERTAKRLAEEPHEKPNADLDPADDDTRMLRAAEEARARRGGEVSSGEAGAVHSASAGSDAAAAKVQPAGLGDRLLDPDERLL